MLLAAGKLIGAGLATIGVAGAGVGIPLRCRWYRRNPRTADVRHRREGRQRNPNSSRCSQVFRRCLEWTPAPEGCAG